MQGTSVELRHLPADCARQENGFEKTHVKQTLAALVNQVSRAEISSLEGRNGGMKAFCGGLLSVAVYESASRGCAIIDHKRLVIYRVLDAMHVGYDDEALTRPFMQM